MTGAAVPIEDFEAVALQLQTNGELSVAANASAPILASYDQEGELAVLLFEYQAADPHAATFLADDWTAVVLLRHQSDGRWTVCTQSGTFQPRRIEDGHDSQPRGRPVRFMHSGAKKLQDGSFARYRHVRVEPPVRRLTFHGRDLMLPPSGHVVMTWASNDPPPEPGAGLGDAPQPEAWDAQQAEIPLERML